MKQILFVTGNGRKVWQARDILGEFEIAVEQADLDVTEIQSHDPLEIVVAKAKAAFAIAGKPLVVCDHAWAFSALKGFPGGYMKDMNHWFEPEDFLNLMRGKTDRRAVLTESVVYIDADGHNIFQKEFAGKLIDKPRGVGDVSCDPIMVFDGHTKTIAEHVDAHEHARNPHDSPWRDFGAWFAAKS